MGNRLASLLCGSSSREFVPCAACRAADGEEAVAASPWWVEGECLLCRAKNRRVSVKGKRRGEKEMSKSGVEEKKGGEGEDVWRRTIAKFLGVRARREATDHGALDTAQGGNSDIVGASSDVEPSPLCQVIEMSVDNWSRIWPGDSPPNNNISAKIEYDTDSDSDSDEEYFMAAEDQEEIGLPSPFPPLERPTIGHGKGEAARKRPQTSHGEEETARKRPTSSHAGGNKRPRAGSFSSSVSRSSGIFTRPMTPIPEEEEEGSKPNTPPWSIPSTSSPASNATAAKEQDRPPTPFETLTAPFPTQLFEDYERAISPRSPSPYQPSEDDRSRRSAAPSPESEPATIRPRRQDDDDDKLVTAMTKHKIDVEDDDYPVSFHDHVDELDVLAYRISQLTTSTNPQPSRRDTSRLTRVRFHTGYLVSGTIPTVIITPPPDGHLPRETTKVHLTSGEVDKDRLWANPLYFQVTRNARNALRRQERDDIVDRRAKRLEAAVLAKTGDMRRAKWEASMARQGKVWSRYVAGFVEDGEGGWRGVDEPAGCPPRKSSKCKCRHPGKGKRKWCRRCIKDRWPRGQTISGEEYLAGFPRKRGIPRLFTSLVHLGRELSPRRESWSLG